MTHQARKRFGQNFLNNEAIIARIIHAINPRVGENLVEIGPGLGALTGPLLRQAKNLSVIELDRDLIFGLTQLPKEGEHITIHECDVLKFDLNNIPNPPLRVIGNLPYNISTPILFYLLGSKHLISDMHFMLQKEVVERMVAGPGTKDYGRLSIMLQYQCKADFLFEVPPSAFTPSPKVTSAIVRITPHRQSPHEHCNNVETLDLVVRSAFSKRRKTLSNALKEIIDQKALAGLNIEASLRPENLSISDFVKIANYVESHK